MILLSDEVLNKYIDGELDTITLNQVRDQLKISKEDRIRLLALQKVHKELGGLKGYEISPEFTLAVMSKLRKKVSAVKKDRFFIFSILSFFGVICLIILGYLFVILIGQGNAIENNLQSINNYFNYAKEALSPIKNVMTSKNISIIGSVLSFGIIISGYLFFENQRHSKRRLSKFH
jgi:hypothetical protein